MKYALVIDILVSVDRKLKCHNNIRHETIHDPSVKTLRTDFACQNFGNKLSCMNKEIIPSNGTYINHTSDFPPTTIRTTMKLKISLSSSRE